MQYANLTTYRDCLKRLVARLGEFDYLFPDHFMVNLENHLLANILETLNEIIADPESYDCKISTPSGNAGPPHERMYKFVKGFSTIACTKDGVYAPKAQPREPASRPLGRRLSSRQSMPAVRSQPYYTCFLAALRAVPSSTAAGVRPPEWRHHGS